MRTNKANVIKGIARRLKLKVEWDTYAKLWDIRFSDKDGWVQATTGEAYIAMVTLEYDYAARGHRCEVCYQVYADSQQYMTGSGMRVLCIGCNHNYAERI
jgi:hypothetical protein